MPDYLTVSAVNEGNTVLSVLVADKHFLTLVIRVEVADVHSVAVELLCGPEELTVVVVSACAHADFLLAVVVEVSDHYVMVAAAVGRVACIETCIEYPALDEFAVADVKSREREPCIVASAIDSGGVNAVEVSDSRVHTLAAVTVVILPCVLGCLTCRDTSRNGKIYGIESTSGSALEESHELRTVKDGTGTVHPVFAAVADDLARAVNSSVAGLCDELSLAVAVEIGYAHLCVMLTGADISAHVYAPQLLTCEGVAVNIDISGKSLYALIGVMCL